MRTIHVAQQSSTVATADLVRACAAVQRQLNEQVAPAWGLAPIQLVACQGRPPHGAECIHLLDDSDQAGAEGYHLLDGRGHPAGYVFARTAEQDGTPWSVVLSHEAIEQAVDPGTDRVGIALWLGRPAALAVEPADPVEGLTYLIDGVEVSDFVFPAWYSGAAGRVDWLGRLSCGLQLAPGGYQSYTTDHGRSWSDTFGQARTSGKEGLLARRQRRRLASLAAIGAGTLLPILARLLASAPVILPQVEQILAELLGTVSPSASPSH